MCSLQIFSGRPLRWLPIVFLAVLCMGTKPATAQRASDPDEEVDDVYYPVSPKVQGHNPARPRNSWSSRTQPQPTPTYGSSAPTSATSPKYQAPEAAPAPTTGGNDLMTAPANQSTAYEQSKAAKQNNATLYESLGTYDESDDYFYTRRIRRYGNAGGFTDFYNPPMFSRSTLMPNGAMVTTTVTPGMDPFWGMNTFYDPFWGTGWNRPGLSFGVGFNSGFGNNFGWGGWGFSNYWNSGLNPGWNPGYSAWNNWNGWNDPWNPWNNWGWNGGYGWNNWNNPWNSWNPWCPTPGWGMGGGWGMNPGWGWNPNEGTPRRTTTTQQRPGMRGGSSVPGAQPNAVTGGTGGTNSGGMYIPRPQPGTEPTIISGPPSGNTPRPSQPTNPTYTPPATGAAPVRPQTGTMPTNGGQMNGSAPVKPGYDNGLDDGVKGTAPTYNRPNWNGGVTAPTQPGGSRPAQQQAPTYNRPSYETAPSRPAPAQQQAPVYNRPSYETAPSRPAPAQQQAPVYNRPSYETAPSRPDPAQQQAPVYRPPQQSAPVYRPSPAPTYQRPSSGGGSGGGSWGGGNSGSGGGGGSRPQPRGR